MSSSLAVAQVSSSSPAPVKKIAFQGGPIQSDIYVRDPFDSNPRWIAEGEYPSWSPDGTKLAYCTREGRDYGQIHIVNADGKGNRPLTHLKVGACTPEWSPDGKQIVVTEIERFTTRIAIVDENGNLVRELGEGHVAHWSPDGTQLVFVRVLPHFQRGGSVWIAKADGSEEREILEDGSRLVQASWLPDGRGLLLTSERDGLSAAYTVDLDGKNLRKLGSDSVLPWFDPQLSPDSRNLIVETADDRNGRVSVLEIDGSTHKARMLAAGMHASVLWSGEGKDYLRKPTKR